MASSARPTTCELVNDLHLPINEEIVLKIKSQDVLHSFFLPNLRVKQDVVPGMKQFVWFRANKAGVYDIVCAELCGWGHYKMRGRLTLQSRADFDRWLQQAQGPEPGRVYADDRRRGMSDHFSARPRGMPGSTRHAADGRWHVHPHVRVLARP